VKIVLDTNVFISGIFFCGPPYRILEAWRAGKVQLALSIEILEEYRRVAQILAEEHRGINLDSLIDLLITNSQIYSTDALPEQVCADPEDDKFICCALASSSRIIVSGDKHLLKVSGYGNVQVLSPRQFVETYIA
jgi:putative PIN family toxin of toxin-antitoxin system